LKKFRKSGRKSKIDELISFDTGHGCPIVGTDEAGRGPLAGPVVAAAVYFPEFSEEVIDALRYIDDSKVLSPALRTELAAEIKKVALWGIAECSVEEIQKYNILQASLLAMKRACETVFAQITVPMDDALILVDGNFVVPRYKKKQKAVKKGDSLSVSISAGSILAKVHRDELMEEYAQQYPQYNWAKNKGYGTKEHIEAIRRHGTCALHRKGFLSKILAEQKSLFE
jgi:ribonuclease HII